RSRIRRWQPQLRTLFILRIASLKYRFQLPGFELPESVRLQHRAHDDDSARMLEWMADAIEQNAPWAPHGVERSHELLKSLVQKLQARQLPPGRIQSFVALLHGIDRLTMSLASDIAAEFGGSPAR